MLIVGNTLAASCFEGKVIDPVNTEPYPLKRITFSGKDLPLVPILLERCPAGWECEKVERVKVLKEGSHEKACKGCQDPWPKRWASMEDKYFVKRAKLPSNEVMPLKIKRLERGKIVLSNWKVLEFDELVWTAPYDYLAELLGLRKPKRFEATLVIMEGEAEWDLAYHLGSANPFYALVRVGEIIWAIGPGSFDPLSAIRHLVRKGYLNKVSKYLSFTITYYAMDTSEPSAPEWVKLAGRTAEWKEMGLLEELECPWTSKR